MSQKEPIRYVKLMISGLVWLFIYLNIMISLCYSLFDFNLISSSDWSKKITDFLEGNWVINSGKELGLFISMIACIPVFLIGWKIVYKIKWGKFFSKLFRKKNSVPLTQTSMPSRKTFNPAPVRVQSSAILTVPIGGTQPSAEAPIPPQMVQTQATLQTPVYEDEEAVQNILGLIQNIAADFFPHVNLEGHYASFAMSTEKNAAVVTIINRPNSTWAIDTEVSIDESDWFHETGILPAPAKDIRAIAQNLRENEPDSTALPVILLMSGTLLNTEEALAYFEKNNVMLLKMPEAEAEGVPLFMNFLEEFFGKKEEQVSEPLEEVVE